MFLFFNPPQNYLQVQLLDPDGFKKSFDQLYEEQYAAAILKARQKRRKSKRNSTTSSHSEENSHIIWSLLAANLPRLIRLLES